MSDFPRLASTRRQFLTSAAALSFVTIASRTYAQSISGNLPWHPFAGEPPQPSLAGWYFFKPDEARAIEAIVDRLIPADELSAGGKEAGCAAFIDRQLAGTYGDSSRLYMQGPFMKGTPTQGYQSNATPAMRYRAGLAAIDAFLRKSKNHGFAELNTQEQDAFLKELEGGKVDLGSIDGKALFNLILQNTMEGFFADPIYGGNRNMVSWKMIGFPGAHYDYRDHVGKHNQPYPKGPISIAGSPDWSHKS
ncbi:MAG: gluconate 2-dehydrogenase subunit 3 family protein [Proteobacteria bacterium]|nr:gluconate 2-dehydrogenase subunit 3 family protein [Pseudomonadota bacterium]